MSRQHALSNRYKEKIVKFKCDETNLNIKQFTVNKNVVVAMPNLNHMILNHFEPLLKNGVFYYSTKIVKTERKNIIFGVCTN